MYNIECNKKFNMALQVLSFQDRYTNLMNNNCKKKIIYIKNEFDNSTFRYRCYNFFQSLEESEKYEIDYFLCSEITKIIKHLDRISIIVFQRTSWTIEVENLIKLAQNKNIPVAYDVDDLIYKIDYAPRYINHIGAKFDKENIKLYLSICAEYELVIKKCDFYITTTEFLKRKLIEDYNKPTFVIPNFLNNEQLSESEYILRKRKHSNEKFIIGYFSGSPSHRNDFKIIENALVDLLDNHSDIYITIVGFMDLEGRLSEYAKVGRVVLLPLVPYQQLQYEIGKVDLNVIPLRTCEINQAKSELKFFEAGIVKVPSCISHTDLYDEFIVNNKNAVFCDSGEWYSKIEELYINNKKYKYIAENAYDTTVNRYLPKLYKEKIEKIYDNILELNGVIK